MTAMKSYVDVILSPSTQHYISNNTMIGALWHRVSSIFWHSDFWLPEGIDWEDIEPRKDFQYPDFYDVWVYPLFLSVFIILFRFFFLEPYILNPLARSAGVSDHRPKSPMPNKNLEMIYQNYGMKPPFLVVAKMSEELNMPQRSIERWLRQRDAITRLTKYDKFVDCGFQMFFHSSFMVYGNIIMFSKPYVWDIMLIWKDYPHHEVDADVWWYYIACLAFYWASTFIQIPSPGRKASDKIQNLVHHMFTILLMVFSWTCNFTRVGTLVLAVHEYADIPLLAGKMCKYAGIDGPTDYLFAIFMILWFFTRCYVFPFVIVHNVFVEAPNFAPSLTFFKVLLIGLLTVNVVWTVLILIILFKKLSGGILDDVRSDVEDFSEEESSKKDD